MTVRSAILRRPLTCRVVSERARVSSSKHVNNITNIKTNIKRERHLLNSTPLASRPDYLHSTPLACTGNRLHTESAAEPVPSGTPAPTRLGDRSWPCISRPRDKGFRHWARRRLELATDQGRCPAGSPSTSSAWRARPGRTPPVRGCSACTGSSSTCRIAGKTSRGAARRA